MQSAVLVRQLVRCRWPAHRLSTRSLSTDPAFQLLGWFSTVPSATFLEQGLLLAHQTGGNWTFELLACTAAGRCLISTATMTYTRKLFTTYAITMHPLNMRERKVRQAIDKSLASGSLPPLMARDIRSKEIERLQAVNKELVEQKNIHPGKGFVVIGLEVLFWLSYVVGLRNIVAGFPAEWADAARTDMQSQGVLWFPDLTIPDPFFILPVVASCTLFFSINMMAQWRHQNRIPEVRILKLVRWASFPMSCWILYCLSHWPSAVSVYMVTSMLIGAGQAYAFTHPAVQRLLRIPQIPGHKPTPVSFKQWLLDWGLKRRNPRQMM